MRGHAKVLPSLVIAGVLGTQAFVLARPQGARLFPFVDYPMYARSYSAGSVYRMREVRARACGVPVLTAIKPRQLAMQPYVYRDRVAAALRPDSSGGLARAALARAVARVAPNTCRVEVWERAIRVTPTGVDPAAFSHPTWALRHGWAP